jgi:hypothetical protein
MEIKRQHAAAESAVIKAMEEHVETAITPHEAAMDAHLAQ